MRYHQVCNHSGCNPRVRLHVTSAFFLDSSQFFSFDFRFLFSNPLDDLSLDDQFIADSKPSRNFWMEDFLARMCGAALLMTEFLPFQLSMNLNRRSLLRFNLASQTVSVLLVAISSIIASSVHLSLLLRALASACAAFRS